MKCEKCGSEVVSSSLIEFQLKKDLDTAYLELNKIRPAVKAIFDREVLDKAAESG